MIVAVDYLVIAISISILMLTFVLSGRKTFVLVAAVVSTFWGVFTMGISWSIPRVVPGVLVPYSFQRGDFGLFRYLPFVLYVFCFSLVLSMFWDIPPWTSPFYGQYRVYLQLATFIALVGATRAIAAALTSDESLRKFWLIYSVAVFVHGLTSFYQNLAPILGLPMIGISRAHGLTAAEQVGDIAMFGTPNGEQVIRAGGLAGEPKTVAVIFGAFLLGYVFGGNAIIKKRLLRGFIGLAALLATFGFVSAFSTSSYVGLMVGFVLSVVLLGWKISVRSALLIVGLFSISSIVWMAWFDSSLAQYFEILTMRSVNRIGTEMDAPVAAMIEVLLKDAVTLILGTGLGGSSFEIMRITGEQFEFSYTPNIGLVALIGELGLVGCTLLLFPFGRQVLSAANSLRTDPRPEGSFRLAFSLSLVSLCLAGSGIVLGFPIGIGLLSVFGKRKPMGSEETQNQ